MKETTLREIAASDFKGEPDKAAKGVSPVAKSAALARRLLLVDLQSQGNFSVGLNVKTLEGRPAAYDIHMVPAITKSASSIAQISVDISNNGRLKFNATRPWARTS